MARRAATASLLTTGPNAGKILIVGGAALVDSLASTEIYDPTTNTFAPPDQTASMNTGRSSATVTTITIGQNAGKILIAGGLHSDQNGSSTLSTTELYDPATNTFATPDQTASMNNKRASATATVITTGSNAGKILIAGGYDGALLMTDGPFSTTELYDSISNSFAPANQTPSMNHARTFATATEITSGANTGRILIAGGSTENSTHDGVVSTTSTELYDPVANSFVPDNQTASMNTARVFATAITISSGPNAGKIFIVGGGDTSFDSVASTELYDPVTNSFAAVGQTPIMNVDREAVRRCNFRPILQLRPRPRRKPWLRQPRPRPPPQARRLEPQLPPKRQLQPRQQPRRRAR